MGDFNSYLHASEKLGGGSPNWRSMLDFQECLTTCQLSDLGHKGPVFTWKRGNLYERVDRACANESWSLSFPHRVVSHLPFYSSNHRPLLLWEGQPNYNSHGNRPFRFLAAWLTHDNFSELVRSTWEEENDWTSASNLFRNKAGRWHRDCFREDANQKANLHARLNGIDRSLSQHPSHALERLQRELWSKLNFIYLREELTWFQWSRANWLVYGDRNSRVFHSTTVARRRRNRIDALKNDAGDWIGDPSILMTKAVDFFSNLYKEDMALRPTCPIRNAFPNLGHADLRDISRQPSNQDIRDVVFSMGPYKAPGVDGLHGIFFQSQWEVVRDSVCSFVKDVFNNPHRVQDVNQTLLCLISKVDAPQTFKDFRPISLCNVIYKVVTKLIANQLKLHMNSLVMPNQCRFIKGRQGTDNVIIAQEIVHSMRSKRGTKGCMAIKVDLEKAYDRLNWDFLRDTLHDLGLPNHITTLIMCCSGQRVNYDKTRVYFSRNVNHTRAASLSQSMGFSSTHDLGRYLGILFHHKRVGRGTFGLSLAGRVTLSKAVVSATPTYAKQVSHIPRSTCTEIEKHIRKFVWSSNNVQWRPALVAWDQVCLTKQLGGLGLRRMKDMNTAFLMKIGHNIMTKPEALWVRVLRCKYNVGGNLMPHIRASRNNSNLWKGLVSYWDMVLSNSRILLGDGINTAFWTDWWLPRHGPLLSYVSNTSSIDSMAQSVSHFVARDGTWDWDCIQHLIPVQVLSCIANMISPMPLDNHDRVIWSESPDGIFSVKSAYRIVSSDANAQGDTSWIHVWRWEGPERVHYFLWILLGDKLMTNFRRVERHMASSVACPRCTHVTETSLHAVRNCKDSLEVWRFAGQT
ncbi:uncharacterized protein LOC133308973 [Gastrolobium bilobum]|uniref:uncharacterized protein LOC133308973 n=1 Tax=Gastrolobium bilobum TaxID=150636 RepID=UPI002AB20A53|nr:uncharacterized protein LOC133308973 [Gastrolobium bilobum]